MSIDRSEDSKTGDATKALQAEVGRIDSQLTRWRRVALFAIGMASGFLVYDVTHSDDLHAAQSEAKKFEAVAVRAVKEAGDATHVAQLCADMLEIEQDARAADEAHCFDVGNGWTVCAPVLP